MGDVLVTVLKFATVLLGLWFVGLIAVLLFHFIGHVFDPGARDSPLRFVRYLFIAAYVAAVGYFVMLLIPIVGFGGNVPPSSAPLPPYPRSADVWNAFSFLAAAAVIASAAIGGRAFARFAAKEY